MNNKGKFTSKSLFSILKSLNPNLSSIEAEIIKYLGDKDVLQKFNKKFENSVKLRDKLKTKNGLLTRRKSIDNFEDIVTYHLIK